MCKLDRLSRG